MPALEAVLGLLEVLFALQPVFTFNLVDVAGMCFVTALLHLTRRYSYILFGLCPLHVFIIHAVLQLNLLVLQQLLILLLVSEVFLIFQNLLRLGVGGKVESVLPHFG